MKSIKEYNTRGMTLWEREELFQKVIPVQLGETVWYAGDCWSTTEPCKVTEENQKEITMFWNSLYFDKEEYAEHENFISHAKYGRWQAGLY